MGNKLLILTPYAVFLLVTQSLQAATNIELEQRIVELERKIEQLLRQKKQQHQTQEQDRQKQELVVENILDFHEDMSSQITKNIKVSGYADVEFQGSNHKGRQEEFRMHHFSLFFTRKFDNKIKFFSEIEYEDAPQFIGENDGSGAIKEAGGSILVEAVNFDWEYSQRLNLRAGRFFTPVGIWSEDHYPPFVNTQERPLHIQKIFPQLVDGLSVFGGFHLGNNNYFKYNFFMGNGESNISGKRDLNSNKAFGFRGNFHASALDDFLIGFSLYQDGSDSANNNAEKIAYGFHVKTRYKLFTTQLEYAKSSFENPISSVEYNSSGYYIQINYDINQWSLGLRRDFYNEDDRNIEKIDRNSFFINYRINENIALKGEYHYDQHNDFSIENYGFYIFSLTGYLGQ